VSAIRSGTAAPAVLAVAVLAIASPACAHGFGDRYDLPVPLSMWVAGAAIAVVLSFVVVGLVVRAPTIPGDYARVNLLRWRPARILVDPRLWLAGRIASIALLLLIVAAGVLGNQNPTRNLAPTAVWVIWWVGVAYLSALLGNIWLVVNPWSAAFAAVERFVGDDLAWHPPYPRALGAWPAVLLFGAFAWTELVFNGRAIPAQLALLILGYSLVTWTGMGVFGRATWLRHGDPFATVFGLLARFAPLELRVSNPRWCHRCEGNCDGSGDGCVNCLECFERARERERELNLRPWAAGLLDAREVSPSMVVFVLLLLATVTFDGFMATPPWSTVESTLYPLMPGDPDLKLTLTSTVGLLAFAILFVAAYRVVAAGVAVAAGRHASSRIAGVFVLSLVPIALAYHLAHYFTYLLIQGQLAIPLASDPFGFGWNLFGTAAFVPDFGLVNARVAWYTSVVAIVIGHIVAVYVAHVVALQEFRERRAVVRSQLVMLALMVGYTTASLWIIAQPIVEFSGTS
jgi:hypothetical protein